MRRAWILLLNLVIFWVGLPAGMYGLGVGVDRLLDFREPGTWALAIGGVLAVAGCVIAGWSIVLLRTIGKGLPISSLPPSEFVVAGPYRVWRHPIYAGYIYAAVGGGLLVGSWGLALVVVPLLGVVWFLTWV